MNLSPLPMTYSRARSEHKATYSGRHATGLTYSFKEGILSLDKIPKGAKVHVREMHPAKMSPYVEISVNGRVLERIPVRALKSISVLGQKSLSNVISDKSFKSKIVLEDDAPEKINPLNRPLLPAEENYFGIRG